MPNSSGHHRTARPLPARVRRKIAALRAPASDGPLVVPVTAVALYAVVPVPGTEHLVLPPLAAHAEARDWRVPAGCAVTDTGPLDQETELRPGWARIRAAVDGGRISGIVVPSFAHIAYRWHDWNAQRSWLLGRNLFVTATDTVTGLEPEESRA
ncbi:hypothetical protein [Streptomyces sp. ML-6]|uniref:hypothetical protein n=1 Tax=Streptomyces sp. ML-6 TaxID=2982693 RepID=UPI0024C05F89|nr:hypothetical protein [Streptomyces sp. ML-6]MDK0517498.1 hypothetical protein [Streptomyces sp. ML-6]MDK0524008.1 hypothetical protein [Streptomyces sp. ML-6]MDK0524782.1 hypothetical protein [Streptomyces sp. ML-6]MDK0524888.1 hypothetical protein [Streptomyces sp. ML-6]